MNDLCEMLKRHEADGFSLAQNDYYLKINHSIDHRPQSACPSLFVVTNIRNGNLTISIGATAGNFLLRHTYKKLSLALARANLLTNSYRATMVV